MSEEKGIGDRITVHNKVASDFKQVHVDGAYGGITPRGLINLSFFAERAPIPKSSEYSVENGKLGKQIENSEDSKKGILREFNFGVYMSVEVAKAVVELITSKIVQFEKVNQNVNKD